MKNKATEAIEPYLEADEVLIWAGQPKKGIVFESSDIVKTIYVIGLFAFTYFATKLLSEISIFIAIPIGIIFYSGCILLGLGRFFIDAELRKKTFYGLTNKRIIIKSGTFPKKFKTVYLNSKPKIEFLPNFDDTSTIDLGIKGPTIAGKGGLGWVPNINSYTSLYRLTDGNFVHQKIREMLELVEKKNTQQ